MSRKQRRQKKSVQRRRKLKHRQAIRARQAHAEVASRSAVWWPEPPGHEGPDLGRERPKASATLLEFSRPLFDLVEMDGTDPERELERAGNVLACAAIYWNLLLAENTGLDPAEYPSCFPLSESRALEVLVEATGRPQEEVGALLEREVFPSWFALISRYPGLLLPSLQVSYAPGGELQVMAMGLVLG